MADNARESGWYWNQYWSADRAASCFEGPGSNYEESVRQRWDQFFAALPDGCEILDIGTGNGAVAAIANQISAQRARDFVITGVDQADIDPQQHLKGDAGAVAGVKFLGGVSASSLPFDDNHFGALTSQFALEYMDLTTVLPELHRVAAADASLQCIVHAEEGVASAGALRELDHCDYLLAESGLFNVARRVTAFVVSLERRSEPVQPQEDAKARKLINAFETSLRRLARHRKESGPHPMLDNVQQVITHLYEKRRLYNAEQLQQHVDTMQGEVEAHAARLQDLRAAACTAQGAEEFARGIGAAGFSTPSVEALLRPHGRGQLGWLLKCRKV